MKQSKEDYARQIYSFFRMNFIIPRRLYGDEFISVCKAEGHPIPKINMEVDGRLNGKKFEYRVYNIETGEDLMKSDSLHDAVEFYVEIKENTSEIAN